MINLELCLLLCLLIYDTHKKHLCLSVLQSLYCYLGEDVLTIQTHLSFLHKASLPRCLFSILFLPLCFSTCLRNTLCLRCSFSLSFAPLLLFHFPRQGLLCLSLFSLTLKDIGLGIYWWRIWFLLLLLLLLSLLVLFCAYGIIGLRLWLRLQDGRCDLRFFAALMASCW